jgi:proline racemase
LRATSIFHAVDSHTEGMPTRVVVGGLPAIPGETMLDRRSNFENQFDDIRRLLMREPRGHSAMSGALLLPPVNPDSDWGVLFVEVSGLLAMCGHGTMGVATVLAETGMVPLEKGRATIVLDVPAGQVRADVTVSADEPTRVRLGNVASFADELDALVTLADGRKVAYDMAYGGNFYAILEVGALGLELVPEASQELISAGLEIASAINEQRRPSHPSDSRIAGCKHVVFTGPSGSDASCRTATIIHPGWIDRSPCGTGTSALMARLHARGELKIGQPFVNESLIGTRFDGLLVKESTVQNQPTVLPEITGRAWITGVGQYQLDPTDPFPAGFEL